MVVTAGMLQYCDPGKPYQAKIKVHKTTRTIPVYVFQRVLIWLVSKLTFAAPERGKSFRVENTTETKHRVPRQPIEAFGFYFGDPPDTFFHAESKTYG